MCKQILSSRSDHQQRKLKRHPSLPAAYAELSADIHATLKATISQRSLQTARSTSTTKAARLLPFVKILFRIAIILRLSRVHSRRREARDNMPVENGALKACIRRSI